MNGTRRWYNEIQTHKNHKIRQWIEAFGFGLRVVEMPFYEDLDYDTMVVEVAEDSGVEQIIENGGK